MSGGSQHPWGREEGGQGLGVLVGAVSKLWGHRGSCCGRARSTIPTACSRLLLCLSILREQGGLGGAAEGGMSVLLS